MRLRRGHELDPETKVALAALDAALAGDPVDAAHDDLRDLAVALRDERPRPRPEFELALDLRAREGFPRDAGPGIHTAAPERRRELHTPQRLRVTPLALGTAAAIFIVATAVLTTGLIGGGGGGDGRVTATAPSESTAPASKGTAERAEPVIPLSGGASDDAAAGGTANSLPAPPDPRDVAPGARRREVERAAELTLSTPRASVEDTADGVVRVTDRHGGFVLSSSVSSGDRGAAGASLELRIPSARLPAALADLSELGHIRSRTQSARDITGEFTSPRRRLADALAQRRGLLRQLAQADTLNETAAVRARLRAVNRRIDRAQAELRRLRERTAFAAVSVTVEAGGAARDGGGWSLGDALRDAGSVLTAILGAALIAGAVLVPGVVLLAVGIVAYRYAVRRRRERALEM